MDADLVRQLLALVDAGRVDAAPCRGSTARSGARALVERIEQGLGSRLLIVRPDGGVETTAFGARMIPRLRRWLEDTEALVDALADPVADLELRVLASHYLATYLIIGRLAAFRQTRPDVRVRLSVRTEAQIVAALRHDPGCAIAFCAPQEFPEDFEYRHWFAMDWWLVVPIDHRLADRVEVSLAAIADEPLIVFEIGSTGRGQQFEAFRRAGFMPRIAMQATTTSLVIDMVEAGLGLSVVPLLPSGRVTRGRRVAAVRITDRFDRIDSGYFVRPAWRDDPVLAALTSALTRDPP
jgi:DNA-binding transcriptional LysR family regulator